MKIHFNLQWTLFTYWKKIISAQQLSKAELESDRVLKRASRPSEREGEGGRRMNQLFDSHAAN